MAEAEEAGEMEGEAGEEGTLSVTLQKYIVISALCFFISLKMLLYGASPSSAVCFRFRACIIEGPGCKRSQKQC